MNNWVEVTFGDVTRRWDCAYGSPAELPINDAVETLQTMVLTCGDLERTAMLSDEVAKDNARVRAVVGHMACWDDEARYVPAVRVYVWGMVSYTDDSAPTVGLCLLVVGLDGTVSNVIPINVEDYS